MLVLLRITIGWHFLYQGLSKFDDPNFSSAGFLNQSKGPLGGYYRNLVPDGMGGERLKPENQPQFAAKIDDYLKRFEGFYKPSDEQVARAGQFAAASKTQIEEFLAENRDEIVTHLHELERLKAAKASKPFPQKPPGDLATDDRVVLAPSVPSQQRRIWDDQSRLQGQANHWLAQLERIPQDF